jgi:4'-phosphopantetheinyl transferase
MGHEELAPGEVQVFLVEHDAVRDPELLRAYDALMTPEERQKQQRFVFDKGRHEALVSRALVRTTLSRFAPVAPEAWRFVIGEHGKPEIAPGLVGTPVRFNLSHTSGLLACAVTREHDVGVDVEWMARNSDIVAIADRFFSSSEVAALHALPETEHQRRFFQYWTLKEAYIKARGLGLALPLGDFSFHLEASPIRISFSGTITNDDPHAWQFTQSFPTREHSLAVAVKRGERPDVRIHVQRVVPLR